METLIREVYGIFKDANTTDKIIITGILRVYKNSLISGTNFIQNCIDDTDNKYTGMFGFTKMRP